MSTIGIVGTFAASLEGAIRENLAIPCEIVVSDETGIISWLPEIDVLVTMVLTPEMGRAATRLKLVQVPGAGIERIERSAVPSGAWLANVYGHENGIAEYVIGAMLTLTRDLSRLECCAPQGRLAEPMGNRCAFTSGLAGAKRQDDGNSRLWSDRPGGRTACPYLRYECVRGAPRYTPVGRGRRSFGGRSRRHR